MCSEPFNIEVMGAQYGATPSEVSALVRCCPRLREVHLCHPKRSATPLLAELPSLDHAIVHHLASEEVLEVLLAAGSRLRR